MQEAKTQFIFSHGANPVKPAPRFVCDAKLPVDIYDKYDHIYHMLDILVLRSTVTINKRWESC